MTGVLKPELSLLALEDGAEAGAEGDRFLQVEALGGVAHLAVVDTFIQRGLASCIGLGEIFPSPVHLQDHAVLIQNGHLLGEGIKRRLGQVPSGCQELSLIHFTEADRFRYESPSACFGNYLTRPFSGPLRPHGAPWWDPNHPS